VSVKAFKNAPGTLRDLFDTARARGDATFLVYEDERWSFAETMAQVDAIGPPCWSSATACSPGDRVAIGMRNYPEWVFAFAAITSMGPSRSPSTPGGPRRSSTTPCDDCGATVLIADQERVERALPARAAPRVPGAGRARRRDLPAGHGPLGGAGELGARCPRSRSRTRRRRHHPLHLGHHRKPQGCGVDPPGHPAGPVGVQLPSQDETMRTGSTIRSPRRRPGRGQLPARVHPHGAPVPRDGLRAGDAVVLRGGAEAGDHVQVEPRSGARAHRAGAGHQLRRRSHPESWDLLESPGSTRRDTSSLAPSAAAAPPLRPSWCAASRASSGPGPRSATA
jgi:hypothetical protein